MRKNHEQLLVMTFLAGLEPEFDSIRPYILGGPDVLSLSDTYHIILRTFPASFTDSTQDTHSNDSEYRTALTSQTPNLAVRGEGIKRRGGRGGRGGRGVGRGHFGYRYCSHCETSRHTRGYCYILNPELRPTQAAKVAASNSTTSSSITLTEEEYSQFRSLLSGVSSSSFSQTPTATMASGKGNTCLLSTVSKSRKWIIDSSASDHMTGESGGAAPVAAAALAAGGADGGAAAAPAVEEKKEEAKEESDDDMGFSLFD